MPEDSIDHIDFEELNKKSISLPIVTHLYTADPSSQSGCLNHQRHRQRLCHEMGI